MSAKNSPLPSLPITEVLDQLQQQLACEHQLILEAPPGAGKTTLVPLALLNQSWLGNQRIIMLEPRRMAARAAARRMASLLGEEVGNTIGYRVRQDSKVGKNTRIEVITEGVLTRMLLDDPALEGIGLIIFDEFHERSLDADLSLALVLQGRELFRDAAEPLRLLVMSATLDGFDLTSLLATPQQPATSVIRSQGKRFPVEIIYGAPKRHNENIVTRVVESLPRIANQHSGNILVFLPGQREINQVMKQLNHCLGVDTLILPLYGALPLREQLRAIEPASSSLDPPQKRRIILATDIAETSLTIEGINIVVDSGLCRQPHFDPASGMTRLHTQRISQNSSVQRMGRAGRLGPGYCYRLWSEEQQQQLAQQTPAQILQADLAPLTLQLLAWGVDNINDLQWLDIPPPGPLAQALDLLRQLGAITSDPKVASGSSLTGYRLSRHGEIMAAMPTHPRLAHMLIVGAQHQLTETATALAALLADRNPFNSNAETHNSVDLSYPIEVIKGQQTCHSRHKLWLQQTRQQSKNFRQLIQRHTANLPLATDEPLDDHVALGFLIANAYPDRIAHRKSGTQSQYLLSNGRRVALSPLDPLTNQEWLAVVELGGIVSRNGGHQHDRIYSASSIDPQLFEQPLKSLVEIRDTLFWDENSNRFIAEQSHCIGKLAITKRRLTNISTEAKRGALIALIRKRGLSLLPWQPVNRQWQARVLLLHDLAAKNTAIANPWPDVSDANLLVTLEQWLGPYLDNINKIADFQQLDLTTILSNLLPWPLPKQLAAQAPTSIKVPSGSNASIDYSQSPPVLNVKLQEMFGCESTPTIANGDIKLLIHLLSPARRPLQITQDLEGFWHGSYADIKKEMKGRYPRHPWPDQPWLAQPTKYTKQRSNKH